MVLIKDGQFVQDDWCHLADDEALPATGKIAVSWDRWHQLRDTIDVAVDSLGVRVPNTVPGDQIGPVAQHFGLIVLSFPSFGDGRTFSQARILRERFGYSGEIRATGNVLRDQLQFMQRCGIDSYEVSERAVTENWLYSLRDFDLFYQPAADDRPWIARQRAATLRN